MRPLLRPTCRNTQNTLMIGEAYTMSNTLLLIEDNLDCARMVQKLLTPLGYVVQHAANGLAGLELARQLMYDTALKLILVDINLPDLSGNVITLQIRHSYRFSTVPIIAFTAETSPKVRRLAMGYGCDGLLAKPIDTQAFPGQIEEFLKAKQSHV